LFCCPVVPKDVAAEDGSRGSLASPASSPRVPAFVGLADVRDADEDVTSAVLDGVESASTSSSSSPGTAVAKALDGISESKAVSGPDRCVVFACVERRLYPPSSTLLSLGDACSIERACDIKGGVYYEWEVRCGDAPRRCADTKTDTLTKLSRRKAKDETRGSVPKYYLVSSDNERSHKVPVQVSEKMCSAPWLAN